MFRQFGVISVALFLLCNAAESLAQGSPNVPLLAHVNSYPNFGYNDCWGYTAPDGREYALLGVQRGTSIIDITNAPVVNEIAFIPSPTSLWKDIKTYRHYAYVVTEAGGGLQIIDLSNLPNSATLVGTYTGLSASHNISIDTIRAMLYAEGEGSHPVRAISLADPLNPVQVSSFGISSHDVYGHDGMLYVSEGGSWSIFNMSNPASPVHLRRFVIPQTGYVHNAWPAEDGQYLMTTEETNGRSVKLWDISNLDSIRMTDEYFASPFVAHNTHVKGNYAYISYYTDGLRIVDISNPYNIFEAGHYDTYPGPSGGFNGAWGAFPFFNSGKVLISDMQTGLYVVLFELPDSTDPNPPTNVRAYSDYSTPTSMRLTWNDPTTFVGGGTLPPGSFSVEIRRNNVPVGSVAGGSQQFVDNGLVDGQEYSYTVYTRLVANDSTSTKVVTRWIAGGSPIPQSPTDLAVGGTATQIVLRWRNPSRNVDGTPMDDFAGVRIYRNGALAATFTRATVDTGRIDSATLGTGSSGPFAFHLVAFDSETPQNVSASSPAVTSPRYPPIYDDFGSQGPPGPFLWVTTNAFVNSLSSNPPTPPNALNLNGRPYGGDLVDMLPVSLVGMETGDATVSYYYQPQGMGDPPEPEDSLLVYFRNSVNEWILVRAYPGTPVTPFHHEVIPIASTPSGTGTYFFPGFQVRFKSLGTPDVLVSHDEWFIDDFALSVLTAVGGEGPVPGSFSLDQNFPNPFNPATTITLYLAEAAMTTLVVYDILGQEVRTLVNQWLEAGTHNVVWDGRSDAGHRVVSGAYVYRLEAGGFVASRKMLVLK